MRLIFSSYRWIFFICLLAYGTLQGQQAYVTVVDAKTSQSVPHAHVCFESTGGEQVHRITDLDGKIEYDLQYPSQIAVSYVGYETLFDSIHPGESIKVRLRPQIQDIDEVVVTAQYAPQKVDQSIYRVKVIGSRMIEKKAAPNLTDLLSNEVNIRTSQDGALGASLSIQGLSGEHVKFLIDGVPVIGRMNGNIDISQLNLYNVDHIEIIEGPMSVVYGSNALAGVVNIITKENKNTRFTGAANVYLESVGIYNFDGGVTAKFGKNHVSLSGGRYFFDGFSDNDSLRSMRWKPKRQWFADGYYIYDNKSLKFKYSASYFNEKLQNKGNLRKPYYETAFDSYFNTHRFNNRLELSKKFRKPRFINLMAAWSFYQRDRELYLNDLTTLEQRGGGMDTTFFNNFLARGTYSKSDQDSKLNYQLGFDINYEIGKGQRIEGNKQSMGDFAAFLSLQWAPIPELMLQPGIRVIYNTRYDAPLVYSINLKWNIIRNLSFRGSYARGFRAPSIKELYLDFDDVNHTIFGNPNLEAENSHNANFSFHYNIEGERLIHSAELNFFYNNINNVITLAQIEGETSEDDWYTYINVDNYITQGFMASYSLNLYPSFTTKVGFGMTGRYSSLSDTTDGLNTFLYSPDLIVNANYKILRWDTDISLFYKYTGRVPQFYVVGESQVEEGYIDAFNMMDITIGKRFIKNSLGVSIGVKNLFNVTDIASVGGGGTAHSGTSGTTAIGWGRTFFIKLSYTFNQF